MKVCKQIVLNQWIDSDQQNITQPTLTNELIKVSDKNVILNQKVDSDRQNLK